MKLLLTIVIAGTGGLVIGSYVPFPMFIPLSAVFGLIVGTLIEGL